MSRNDANWKLTALAVENEGERVYRIRETFPENFIQSDFAQMVVVEWRFGEDGLPDSTTSAALTTFESFIEILDDPSKNSILVHVYTGGGIREWCFYAKDYGQFIKDINVVLAGKPRFPIDIMHSQDAIWKYRDGILKASEGN